MGGDIISGIERANLPDMIADELKLRILNKTWKVGEKLPSENDLSKEFNVNRLTVRLAITKLNTLGIVETKTGEGTFVRKLDLYNYINQIIPFILSSQDINHVLDFENEFLMIESNNKFTNTELKEIIEIRNETEKLVVDLQKIYRIIKQYDFNIVESISEKYWLIKEKIVNKSDNTLLKSIYFSLKDVLIEHDKEYIKSLDVDSLDILTGRLDDLIKRSINVG